MKQGEIRITYVELGLGILVVVLSGLLVFSYLSCSCDAGATGAVVKETVEQGAAPEENAPSEEAPAEATNTEAPAEAPEKAEPSCDDGLLNQDETDVDCGGSCPACADGLSCKTDSDCQSQDCNGGRCRAAPELSGEVSFSLTDIATSESTSGAVKVTAVSLSVENGLAETGEYELQVFLKSDDNLYYLNQNKDALEREKYVPYAVIELAPVPSGETLTFTYELAGLYTGSSYVYSLEPGVYEKGDDFRVEARLVDSETGDVLKKTQRRVRV